MSEKFYYPLMRKLRISTWTRVFFFIMLSLAMLILCLYLVGILDEIVMFFVFPFLSLLYFSMFSIGGRRFTSAGGDIFIGLVIWVLWVYFK